MYKQYVDDVLNNRITTCEYIKLSCKRFNDFLNRDDMYFDDDKVQHVINFIGLIKHYKGKSAGKSFVLEPWQEFFVANIFGFYWKNSNLRVCRNVFLSVARKNGKSALVIGIILYMLFFSDNAPEIVECAASRENSRDVLLKTTVEFANSIDPKSQILSSYKNEIKCKSTKGNIKVISSDSTKINGLNLNCFVYDEFAEAKDNLLWGVLNSSMGNREEPLSIACGTVSYNLSSPYYDMYQTSIEILNGVKVDDSFFPLIYSLDEDDDYLDEKVWIKSNPNLGVCKYYDYLKNKVQEAKNNSSVYVSVLTKDFNVWCSSSDVWIRNDRVIKSTKKLDINDFKGSTCYVGVDLACVNDLTAVSYMFYKNEKYYFFTDFYLPQSALTEHKQKEFYKNMYFNKYLKVTAGNSTDYNYITQDLLRINSICPIQGIYYDSYNSRQWAIECTELGLPLYPFSQNVGNFNRPTKEFLRLILDDKIELDDNELVRFCINNVVIFPDYNGNEKPKKIKNGSKIDAVISMIQALGGYLLTPHYSDDIYNF